MKYETSRQQSSSVRSVISGTAIGGVVGVLCSGRAFVRGVRVSAVGQSNLASAVRPRRSGVLRGAGALLGAFLIRGKGSA